MILFIEIQISHQDQVEMNIEEEKMMIEDVQKMMMINIEDVIKIVVIEIVKKRREKVDIVQNHMKDENVHHQQVLNLLKQISQKLKRFQILQLQHQHQLYQLNYQL
jgi:hypothetical protein